MALERCTGRHFMLTLSGLALAACSQASTAPQGNKAVTPVAAAVTTAPLVSGLPDFSALVQTFGPAVVNVRVTAERPQRDAQTDMLRERMREFGFSIPNMPDNQGPAREGEGSGFIVSADGYILTNRHVVVNASEVMVKLLDRREFKAKVIGMDENTDVAVLKIEGSNLPTVRMGDPEKLKPGQWVVAIGSPFGMENTVTAGIVSATARSIQGEQFVPFIQTDVAVNPGNSGGPLFNLNGEVVGINSQIYSRTGSYMGLSFAIPIDMANSVREQLVSNGKVTRGRIGVVVESMNADKAESFGLDRPRGALISEVEKDAPADKAGIKPGDIILSVGARPVSSEALLPSMVAALKPGSNAEFEIWREGQSRTLTVRIGETPDKDIRTSTRERRGSDNRADLARENAALGLSVRPLTSEEKQQARTRGSLVVDDVSGAAEKAGIQPDDIILGVGSTNVSTVAELRSAVEKNAAKQVPLRVQRGERVQFVVVPRG
jgi:serine protease Do